MSVCSHTPHNMPLNGNDQRCEVCRLGMAQPSLSYHRFEDAETQRVHDKEAGKNG